MSNADIRERPVVIGNGNGAGRLALIVQCVGVLVLSCVLAVVALVLVKQTRIEARQARADAEYRAAIRHNRAAIDAIARAVKAEGIEPLPDDAAPGGARP